MASLRFKLSIMDVVLVMIFGGLFVFVVALSISSLSSPKLSNEEEKAAVVETARIEKLTVELETANKGDLLEVVRQDGSHIWVVVGPFRNNERHDFISYQRFGGSIRQETTAWGLIAEGVVRVHRMDTPEWNKKAVEFFKQK